MSIMLTYCKGCQWEGNCNYTMPCPFHTGRDEIDNAVDYIVSLFECMEEYQKVVDDFSDNDCVE